MIEWLRIVRLKLSCKAILHTFAVGLDVRRVLVDDARKAIEQILSDYITAWRQQLLRPAVQKSHVVIAIQKKNRVCRGVQDLLNPAQQPRVAQPGRRPFAENA